MSRKRNSKFDQDQIPSVHPTLANRRRLLMPSRSESFDLEEEPTLQATHYPTPTTAGANYLTEEKRLKIFAMYQQATESELMLIDYMLGKFEEPEQVLHFFLGGHIELHGDYGINYQLWEQVFGADGTNALKNRISSHKSQDQQHAIAGPVLSEALFGTRFVDATHTYKYTWIQLESHPVGGLREWTRSAKDFRTELLNFFLHMVAFFDYRWNKHNIGPHGKSSFTEANPLKIDVSKLTPEREQQNRELWKQTFILNPGVTTPELSARMEEILTSRLTGPR